MKNRDYYHGTYKVINKDKYIGNHIPIFRSGWEKRLFFLLR